MIKLVTIQPQDYPRIRLAFSDGSLGIYDASHLVAAGTPMTVPLEDPEFFQRCFIEVGALAWPNGVDLSARLHQRLKEKGELHCDDKAA